MSGIYKSDEGERVIRERYGELLKLWPVPHEKLRVPTSQGETFVIASGERNAPPLTLLHGSMTNAAMWLGDIAAFAAAFRVYAVDVIGEPGFSAPSRPPLKSDAHARWLDDVLDGLSLERAAIYGASLGGWLAMDYAVRRPGRVTALVLNCPAGIGRQKLGLALKIVLLRLFGRWGAKRAMQMILGKPDSEGAHKMAAFLMLINDHFRPRMVSLPIFSDRQLEGLRIPVLAILGGKDALLDSTGSKRRLERIGAAVRYYPDAHHFVPDQSQAVIDFLRPTP